MTVKSQLGRALSNAVDDALVETVVAAITEAVPRYAVPLEGAFGRGVRRGVRDALTHFADRLAAPAQGPRPELEVSGQLGRGEARRGRSLADLLSAYRVGTRVAWRRFAEVAAERDPAAVAGLAELLFAYVDELSAAAADGFSVERAQLAGALSSRRRALARALLAGAPRGQLEEAAALAAWPLPARVAVAVGVPGLPLALRLGEEALVLDEPAASVALLAVPGPVPVRPPGLADLPVAVGPAVAPASAPDSRRLADRLITLRAGGSGPPAALWVEDHLLDLLLAAEPVLLAALAERHLGGLATAPSRSRAWLRPTLLAWLRHDGSRAAVAAELHVHPQTVRYRVERLRELLGARLDDPQARREIEVVLRAQR